MWSHIRMVVVCITFTLISVTYFLSSDQHRQALIVFQGRFSYNTNSFDASKYLVYGKNCRIHNIDPFDKSILKYLEPSPPVVCSSLPLLSAVERRNGSNVLIIDQGLVSKYKKFHFDRLQCCYSVITRTEQTLDKYNDDADSKYRLDQCIKFDKKATLNNTIEFLLVKCQSIPRKSKQGKIVYQNAHAMVPILPKLQPKLVKPKRSGNENTIASERLNVLVIGIDSISRSSLRRTMPKTLGYFQKTDWMELDGYNKIADNTLPNVMAILAGRTMEQLFSECYKEKLPILDGCPNIWKNFSKDGYVTAYAEDIPAISTFNYRMTGFVDQPTDFYMRPFMVAASKLLPYKNKDSLPICIGPQSNADLIFNYAKDFATTFHKSYFFGVFWLNSFSHNNVNSPAALDLRLRYLLTELEDTGIYNNTLILVLSDHGIRFGDIRDTFIGYLEERLPFIFLHLPHWFKEKYHDAYLNLVTNKNRLTSPYDVHATLLHLRDDHAASPKSCPTCKSLFLEVPTNRSCAEAGIDPHWCVCPDFQAISPNNSQVKKLGEFLIQTVHNRTTELLNKEKLKLSTCLDRSFVKFIRIHRSQPHEIEITDEQTQVFVVVVETDPFGQFEATIQLQMTPWGPKFKVVGFISRIDSYFSTSKCVKSKMLQFYCHCPQ